MPTPVDHTYRDIKQWKNAPMQKLVLVDTASGDRFLFFNPTADSTWEIVPSVRRDGMGGERVVGWIVRIVFRMLQNDLEDVFADLDTYFGNLMSAVLILKPAAAQTHGRTVSIALNSPAGVVWGATKDETGPVFEIRVSKAVSSLHTNASVSFWQDDHESVTDPVS